ncbi:hypothetical protein NQ317_005357 [Molorchus minor]|uniref:AH domain-containing protein n=1 Tax=Molorchus minor TaxID=1323400 RepID=A0ABQ9J2T0_9CUCU|nr:hypothetical protein NQ317_005357 [Molorchus minor]
MYQCINNSLSVPDEVVINYNKLHADPCQGKSLDIVLKKMKHRLVENMSSSTADALGLSRAILCNDTLVKKMQELQDTEVMYRGLVDHCRRVLQAHMELQQAIKAMGDVFAGLAVREPQPRASEAFRLFGEQHRNMEKIAQDMVLSDMGTYLYKAIPDTRLTVKKYADAKFEYLAYCLKVKEMTMRNVVMLPYRNPFIGLRLEITSIGCYKTTESPNPIAVWYAISLVDPEPTSLLIYPFLVTDPAALSVQISGSSF